LTYGFDAVGDKSANVVLRWERVAVPFKVEVKDVVGSTMNRLRAYVADAKADEWQRPFNAANKLTDDANKWYDQAVKSVDVLIVAKPTFANYRAKSNILFNAGRTQEALAATEKAVEVGKAEKADTAALEKRIADLKAGKQ
jgi:tetratricopeptide (TPR) repeat protein